MRSRDTQPRADRAARAATLTRSAWPMSPGYQLRTRRPSRRQGGREPRTSALPPEGGFARSFPHAHHEGLSSRPRAPDRTRGSGAMDPGPQGEARREDSGLGKLPKGSSRGELTAP